MSYSNRYKVNRAKGLSHVFTLSAASVHCKHWVKRGTQKLQVVNGGTVAFDCLNGNACDDHFILISK